MSFTRKGSRSRFSQQLWTNQSKTNTLPFPSLLLQLIANSFRLREKQIGICINYSIIFEGERERERTSKGEGEMTTPSLRPPHFDSFRLSHFSAAIPIPASVSSFSHFVSLSSPSRRHGRFDSSRYCSLRRRKVKFLFPPLCFNPLFLRDLGIFVLKGRKASLSVIWFGGCCVIFHLLCCVFV